MKTNSNNNTDNNEPLHIAPRPLTGTRSLKINADLHHKLRVFSVSNRMKLQDVVERFVTEGLLNATYLPS